MDTRKCKKCGTEKPVSEFHTRSDNKNKPRSTCIDCVKRAREKECHSCGDLFVPYGRRSYRCVSCYSGYRQAVNLLSAAQYRSKIQGLEFDLTVEWIEEKLKNPCPRAGFNFELLNTGTDYSNRSPYGPSLDKIDPSKGYTKDNVQVVCWWYNCAKQRFSDNEVIELCKAVAKIASS